jgi:hypothetical protein
LFNDECFVWVKSKVSPSTKAKACCTNVRLMQYIISMSLAFTRKPFNQVNIHCSGESLS